MSLPPGFVLDQPRQTSALPPGFVLDQPEPVDFAAKEAAAMPWNQALAVGVGRGFNDVGQGLKQMALESVSNPLASGTLGPVAWAAGQAFPGLRQAANAELADQTRQQRGELESYKKLSEAQPWAAGVGRVAGNIAAMPIPAGKAATLPAMAAKGAMVGGMSGAAQYVPEGGSRALNTAVGASLGAVLPGLLKGVSLTYGGVKTLAGKLKDLVPGMTNPARERLAAQLIRESAANPSSLAQAGKQPQFIPGTQQTLAEATNDPGIAGLQRTLASMDPRFNNELTNLAQANNTARVEAIRAGFGGADEASARAIEVARDKAAAPLLREAYASAPNASVRDRSALDRLSEVIGKRMSNADFQGVQGAQKIARAVASGKLTRDEALAAMQEISVTSKTAGDAIGRAIGAIDSGIDLNPTLRLADRILKARKGNDSVTGVLSGVRDLLSREGMDSVQVLHNARQEIGNIMNGLSPNLPAGRTATAELMAIRKSLDKQIEKAAPQFQRWLKLYTDSSREAGRVRMGDELLGKSFAARDAAGNPILSPAQFARAANDLDRVAKAATGFRKETAQSLMTPEQRTLTEAMRADLDRLARSQTGGKAVGSNTIQNLMGAANVRGTVAGETVGAMAPGVMGMPLNLLNSARRHYGEKTVAIVQEMLMNPQRAQQLLSQYPAAQRQQVMSMIQNPTFQQFMSASMRGAPMAAGAAVSADGQQQ